MLFGVCALGKNSNDDLSEGKAPALQCSSTADRLISHRSGNLGGQRQEKHENRPLPVMVPVVPFDNNNNIFFQKHIRHSKSLHCQKSGEDYVATHHMKSEMPLFLK